MNKADLLSYIEQIINLDEFWQVNYYLRSMKKAPHGGIIHINYPNIYLKYYPFQTWTLATDEPERIPVFMTNLVETAVKLYFECEEPDLEELLQYCYNGDNWYLGFRLLHIKPEFAEQNAEIGGTFLWSVLSNNKKIVDYFDIELKYAIYSLILVIINERAYVIKDLNEILIHEQLKKPHNKYGLTLVNDIAFMRQGFRLHDSYYLYNIFIDPSIGHPSDIMPYTFRIMVDEIENMDIYMRCDEELAVPYSDMISTATDDSQKFFGIKKNADMYDKMIDERRDNIEKYNIEISEIVNMDKTIKDRKSSLKQTIAILDDIMKDNSLSNATLHMLIDKIIIKDDGDGLSLDIQVKSPFRCSEKSRHFGSKVMAVDYRQYNTFEQVKVS